MPKPACPFWPPQSLESLAFGQLLKFAPAWRTLLGLAAPAALEPLDIKALRPAATKLPDDPDGLLQVVGVVPWKGPVVAERPSVLLVGALPDRPWPVEDFAERLRVLLTEIWSRGAEAIVGPREAVTSGLLVPVLLPIVYLGRDPWKPNLSIASLRGSLAKDIVAKDPKLRVLLIPLRSAEPAALNGAGPLGKTLRAWQSDTGRAREFVAAFEEALASLEAIPVPAAPNASVESLRQTLLTLLVHVMTFRRDVGEFPRLRQALLSAFSDARRRREVEDIMRTIFDSCSELGELKARREVLVDLMTAKFGPLPEEDAAHVRGIADGRVIDRLIRRVLTARDLEDMGLWDAESSIDG